ncbi:MAG: hypothetical protein E7164_04870 [Firmicutes bacterium]|nr:hypothetical protein [Bacillota bacterium]
MNNSQKKGYPAFAQRNEKSKNEIKILLLKMTIYLTLTSSYVVMGLETMQKNLAVTLAVMISSFIFMYFISWFAIIFGKFAYTMYKIIIKDLKINWFLWLFGVPFVIELICSLFIGAIMPAYLLSPIFIPSITLSYTKVASRFIVFYILGLIFFINDILEILRGNYE